MAATDRRISLQDLGARWRENADQLLELAIAGDLPLWLSLSEVFLQPVGKPAGRRKKPKPVPKVYHHQVEVRPQPDFLAQLRGQGDRLIIAAELHGTDSEGSAVLVTNSVGGEWGEMSMIGLNPSALFAREEDVLRIERLLGEDAPPFPEAAMAGAPQVPLNRREHSCHAPELEIAISCWQALFAHAEPTEDKPTKSAIRSWLQQRYPDLSRAAVDRIAAVVSPAKGEKPLR